MVCEAAGNTETESIGVLPREERGVLFTADTELRETEPEAERAP